MLFPGVFEVFGVCVSLLCSDGKVLSMQLPRLWQRVVERRCTHKDI